MSLNLVRISNISRNIMSTLVDSAPKDEIQVELVPCPIDHIRCVCGNICHKNKRFSVYDVDFCSMNCLRPFKQIEDSKKTVNQPVNQFKYVNNCGGPGCF